MVSRRPWSGGVGKATLFISSVTVEKKQKSKEDKTSEGGGGWRRVTAPWPEKKRGP